MEDLDQLLQRIQTLCPLAVPPHPLGQHARLDRAKLSLGLRPQPIEQVVHPTKSERRHRTRLFPRGEGVTAARHPHGVCEKLTQEEPNSDVDALLDHAVLRVAPLLDDLGRDEEAAAAYKRIIERFKAKKTVRARAVVATARAWLRLKGR
jgi:hypothetical protein